MGQRDRLYHRQSQSASLMGLVGRTARRGVAALERIKNFVSQYRVNTGAAVRHAKTSLSIIHFGADNQQARMGVFLRIFQQRQ